MCVLEVLPSLCLLHAHTYIPTPARSHSLAAPALTSALDEISELLSLLGVWEIREPSVTITFDGLMSPTEDYFSGVFFQVIRRFTL